MDSRKGYYKKTSPDECMDEHAPPRKCFKPNESTVARDCNIIFAQLTEGCGYPNCTNKYCITSPVRQEELFKANESDAEREERMRSLACQILRSHDYPRHCFCEQTNPNLPAEDRYPQPKPTALLDEIAARATTEDGRARLRAFLETTLGHPLTLALSFLRPSAPQSPRGSAFCDFSRDDLATVAHIFEQLSRVDRLAPDTADAAGTAGAAQATAVATAYGALRRALGASAVLAKERYAYLAVRFFMVCLATPAGQSFDTDFIVGVGDAVSMMSRDTRRAIGRACSRVFGYDYVRRAAVKLTEDSSRWAAFRSSVLVSMKMLDDDDDDDDDNNNDNSNNNNNNDGNVGENWNGNVEGNDGSDSESKKYESRLRKCGYKPWSDAKITSLYKFIDILYNENDRLATALSNNVKQRIANDDNDVSNENEEKSIFVKDSEWYNTGISASEDLYNDYRRFRDGKPSFLGKHPYAIRLMEKTLLIRLDSRQHQASALLQNVDLLSLLLYGIRGLYTNITVRRAHLVEDSLDQLERHRPEDFAKELRVAFEGEDGVDAGGVRKEWFQLLVASVIDPRYGMFSLEGRTRTFWFAAGGNSSNSNNSNSNSNSSSSDSALGEFYLIGKIVALAIYNGVILDLRFPRTLYKKLKNVPVSLADLRDVHPDIHSSLCRLLAMDPADVPDLDLTFSVMENAFGRPVERELCSGGAAMAVDGSNREEYVRMYTKYLLVDSVARQFNAFKSGFDALASLSSLLQLLSPGELELAICGNPVLDWAELEENTHYREGYSKKTPVIQAFWRVFRGLSEDDKKTFLRFTTGSDRCPVGGLKDINLVIMRNGSDQDALPTSKTCFNILLLPEYDSEERLREKFLMAIQCSTGFGLK